MEVTGRFSNHASSRKLEISTSSPVSDFSLWKFSGLADLSFNPSRNICMKLWKKALIISED